MKDMKTIVFVTGTIVLLTAILTLSGCLDIFTDSDDCSGTHMEHPITVEITNIVKVVDRNDKAISNLPIKFSTKKIPCDKSSKPSINSNARTKADGKAYSGFAKFNINNSKDKIQVQIEVYDINNKLVDSKITMYLYSQFKDLPEFDTNTTIKLPKEYWQYNDDI